MSWMGVVIPAVFMVSFAGMAYVVMKAMQAGMDNYAGEYSSDTARQFEDIFLFIPPERIHQIALSAAAGSFILFFLLAGSLSTVVGVLRGAIVGCCMAAAALCAPRWLLRFLRAQRLRRFNLQLVDALVSMSNALKAGFSITQAFESVMRDGFNPIAQEFSVLIQQTRLGVRFEDGLTSLEKRVNSEDLTLMIRSIEIARMTGGNLTEVFEKIAATIRERMRIEGRIRSLTAQGRLQGIVVGLMPMLLGVVVFFIDPKMMMAFLTSSVGLLILVLVGILELAGALMIRRIVRIDV